MQDWPTKLATIGVAPCTPTSTQSHTKASQDCPHSHGSTPTVGTQTRKRLAPKYRPASSVQFCLLLVCNTRSKLVFFHSDQSGVNFFHHRPIPYNKGIKFLIKFQITCQAEPDFLSQVLTCIMLLNEQKYQLQTQYVI